MYAKEAIRNRILLNDTKVNANNSGNIPDLDLVVKVKEESREIKVSHE